MLHATHTHWTVSYRHRSGGREHTTTYLGSPEAARAQYGFFSGQDCNTDVRITEHVTRLKRVLATLSDLPGSGEPTPLPPLPDGAHQVLRHFTFARRGPAVLRTGDDVRDRYAWLIERGSADAQQLQLIEETLTRYSRLITPNELPDVAPPTVPEPGARTDYLAAHLPLTRRNLEAAAKSLSLSKQFSPVCPCFQKHPGTPSEIDEVTTRVLRLSETGPESSLLRELAQLLGPCPAAHVRAAAVRALEEGRRFEDG